MCSARREDVSRRRNRQVRRDDSSAHTEYYFSALLRFNKNPLSSSFFILRRLNINRLLPVASNIKSSNRICPKPTFSTSHALSLSVVLYLNFCVHPRAYVCGMYWRRRDGHTDCCFVFAFILDYVFMDYFRIVSPMLSRQDPVEFISITKLVRVSKRKGEKGYLYSGRIWQIIDGKLQPVINQTEKSSVRLLIDGQSLVWTMLEGASIVDFTLIYRTNPTNYY